jgi:hypothetical protein
MFIPELEDSEVDEDSPALTAASSSASVEHEFLSFSNKQCSILGKVTHCSNTKQLWSLIVNTRVIEGDFLSYLNAIFSNVKLYHRFYK